MNAKHWEKIKDLLDEVLQIEPAGRIGFLEKAGIAGETRAEIESLLVFEKRSRDFMSLDLNEFSKDFVAEDETEFSLVGQRVGIYEITAELGCGGMGAVYLAERADGKFKQKVAVKMLKRELNVGELRKNFRREREILSKLEHPNVARLLDAGSCADGVPFLVMEYVEGLPIDRYCEAKNLPLTARLKLFNRVCEAVSFAHRNLIVHRDLKPSNILVTEKGEPKLLDFGISKLLDAQEKTLTTAFGAMTPEYAAPEQITGENVSTASDVYSLGVVLYKMLTGALPFDLKNKTNGDVLKAITEEEPTAPSSIEARKRRNGEAAISHSSSHFSPSRLRPFSLSQIRGDLDNIILKALSKEPERRYKTVERFSGDIWRHLDGLPVSARPATAAYRAGKFFRRNRISVVAAVLIFSSLIGGIAVAVWQAREARAQANLAIESQRNSEIETEKAREEQRKSEKVTKFVSKIFGYANPGWFAEGAKTEGKARVIDVVEELSGKIDTEFAAEPDVAAELHSTFAEIFHWVSKKAPTEEERRMYQQKRRFHALRGLELRRQFYGERHELVAKDLYGSYGFLGETDEERAKVLMEAILMMRETNPRNLNYAYMFESYTARLMLPEYEPLHEPYRNAVVPRTDENKYQIAERMLREAIPVWQIHYPPDHFVILARNCWLAYALAKQDKWAEFDAPYQICKQLEAKQEIGAASDLIKGVELIEKVLAEKERMNLR